IFLPTSFACNTPGSAALRKYSRSPGVLPVKIVPWETEVAVEPNDNFAHPRYTSFSLGTDASWRAALQVAAVRDAVPESSGRGGLRSYIRPLLERINDPSCNSLLAPIINSCWVWRLD